MRKKILALAIAVAAVSSGSIFAQAQNKGDKAVKAKTECCADSVKNKGSKKKEARSKANPFEGIDLTADQQQRLQELRKGLGPVILDKEQQKALKEQNKNLSDEQKKQLKQEKKAKKLEAKKNYLKGVKEVLTPEQYVVFLENVYIQGPQTQKMAKTSAKKSGMKAKGNKGKASKAAKDGKGKRGDKGVAPKKKK